MIAIDASKVIAKNIKKTGHLCRAGIKVSMAFIHNIR